MSVFVSKKRAYSGTLPSFYVGRPSPLGNPFPAEVYGLDKCLEMYQEHLIKNIDTHAIKAQFDLIRRYAAAGDIVLLCWCRDDFSNRKSAKKCHADIIKDFI